MKRIFVIFALCALAFPLYACKKDAGDIEIVVSGHKTSWDSGEGIYSVVNREGVLSAVVVPDKTGEAEGGGWRRKGKETVFTLFLNPVYRSDKIEMTADGIDLLPLTLGKTGKCVYFTGGEQVKETLDTALVANYRLQKSKKHSVKIAFNVEKQKMSPACWTAYSATSGEVSDSASGITVFKEGFSEIKKGDKVNGMVFGEDYSIIVDLRESDKAQLIKIEKGASTACPFSLKKESGGYFADIEGVKAEFRLELGSLTIKQANGSKTTLMRFEKTDE